MAVDIFTEGAFSAGPPTPAFERLDPARDFRFVNDIGADIGYDVSPDGRRFLVIEALADQETSETRKARTSIHVVQNWYEEFRDRQ